VREVIDYGYYDEDYEGLNKFEEKANFHKENFENKNFHKENFENNKFQEIYRDSSVPNQVQQVLPFAAHELAALGPAGPSYNQVKRDFLNFLL